MKKTLPDGLILRSLSEGYECDRERLPVFYRQIFAETEEWIPDDDTWVASLLSDEHPTITDDEVWVVVDPAENDKLVSTVLLIPQTWRYETIELPVGRPELVATHPDYRHRGLIRALMNVAHARSAALGHNVQGITGIAHYYRRFGYTMAVDLGQYAAIPMASVPKLKDDQQPAYTLRPAQETDLPLLAAWDAYMAPQFALSVVRSAPLWQHLLARAKLSVQVIVDREGLAVGYVILHRHGDSHTLTCLGYIVGENTSYVATYDDVLRGMKAYAEARYSDNPPLYIGFDSGQTEALNILIRRMPQARTAARHYAWYLRTASPARLIMDIRSVLEQRLLHSGAHRFTGELKINFYNLKGLRIDFQDGCIVKAQDIQLPTQSQQNDCHAAFPWEFFLSIVFGHRTYDEIQHILPESYANAQAEVLLRVLFPVKPGRLFAV